LEGLSQLRSQSRLIGRAATCRVPPLTPSDCSNSAFGLFFLVSIKLYGGPRLDLSVLLLHCDTAI
jgi:hypothetical protein